MSGWLEDAIGAYLKTVTEREFDPVFIALLRTGGFDDIHQIHGSFEFGKDFIAKRDGYQWAFQTKVGDIGLSAWRTIRSQVDEMLWNDIAHPSFDTSAHRQAVLVTTGRLVGGAAAEAQQYSATLARRSPPSRTRWPMRRRSRPPRVFDVWDRDTVAPDLSSRPELSLNDWTSEPLRNLLGLLADADRRTLDHRAIESSTRDWTTGSPWQAVLAASLAANRLKSNHRLDLACTTAYGLCRGGAVMSHDQPTAAGESCMDAGRALFRESAREMDSILDPTISDAERLFRASNEMPGSATYPVRCSLVVQTLGMLGLLHLVEGESDEAAGIADRLERFVIHQPGASHPISDRWAISLVPASALLRRFDSAALQPWLQRIAVWVCDRHDQSPGLASVYASPEKEIVQLLGEPYEHLSVPRRKQSFLATVVLDLASILGLNEVYDDVLNDFFAVDLAFPVVEPSDELGQYGYEGPGLYSEANIQFDESYDKDGWKRAVHHRRAPNSYALDRRDRSWELLACSLLLRDRHFLPTTRLLSAVNDETGLPTPS